MESFGNHKWLFNLFLLSLGLNMTGANIRFANVGQAIQLNCPYKRVNSWQSRTNDFLAVCENDRPMINKDLNIIYRISISSDCTILTITNLTKEDAGTYVCFFFQKDTNKTDAYLKHAIHVKLRNSPVVQNQSVTLLANDRPRTLECNASGVPDVYNFSAWQHYSYNYKLVRSLEGDTNGSLILQNNYSTDPFYEDSGIYTCSVTNGVLDQWGNLWNTKSIKVTIEGKPVLAKPHNNTYTGYLNATSIMSIFVLSSSNVSRAIWKSEIEDRQKVTLCIPSMAVKEFYGIQINISGYICEFQIHNTTLKDFQTYKVDIENKRGKNTFEVSLILAALREPEKPQTVVISSSSKYIFLEWQSGLNGGSHQSFIIQYRKKSSKAWKYLKANETNNTKQSIYILNLEPSTKYEVWLYAYNEFGNSTLMKHSISTKEEQSNENKSYWTEFLLVLVIIIPVCIVITWWRLKKAINSSPDNSHRENEDRIQVEGGAIENNLYQAANDLIEQPSVFSNREDDAYSCIDKRKPIVYRQEVTYNISKKGNKMRKSDQIENKDQHQSSMGNGLDHPNLNYAEVSFDNATHNVAFYIHGADARTPYADIDFSATADPWSSSEENKEDLLSGSAESDDFVSLEEVQQWMICKE